LYYPAHQHNLLMLTRISGCDSDIRTTPPTETDAPVAAPNANQIEDPVNLEGDWSLQIASDPVTVIEGGGFGAIDISIDRGASGAVPIALSTQGVTAADENNLVAFFDDSNLGGQETNTTLRVRVDIGARPIQPHERTILITGTDGTNDTSLSWTFSVQPTNAPDVYLIVGQSNAVGFSEDNSKMALRGQPDEPFDNILQLNVTGNDSENFPTADNFTLESSLFNVGSPLSIAVDPLHTGFNTAINGKAGDRIGFGLTFAKQALADTTADIYLVPAAWSDTGFCSRATNRFPGMGWNAAEPTNPNLSGTLLHDRAIVRTNITLNETGGILRGILWHQGEADSENASCSSSYGSNLSDLADSLRSNINEDARGPSARGIMSDIPFVVGTMSKGADFRDNQLPFSTTKRQVDAVHRNVASLIPNSGFVNADDLVPPAYPCGEGSCVHFGAAALREMGNRYYRELKDLLPD